MRINFVNIRQILQQNSWFQACPPGLQDSLIEQSQIVEIADGAYLCRRGEPATGLFCLVDGRLLIGGGGEGGKEAILAIIEAPYWFGEMELFDEGPRTHDARAEGAATVIQIPQEAIRSILEREPRYWRDMGLLTALKTRVAFKAIEDSKAGSSLTRVARRILAIFEGHGFRPTDQRALLTASQEQLALMLGLSRQTVNQLLGKLEKQDAIRRHYGGIEVLDAAKLSEIGGQSS